MESPSDKTQKARRQKNLALLAVLLALAVILFFTTIVRLGHFGAGR